MPVVVCEDVLAVEAQLLALAAHGLMPLQKGAKFNIDFIPLTHLQLVVVLNVLVLILVLFLRFYAYFTVYFQGGHVHHCYEFLLMPLTSAREPQLAKQVILMLLVFGVDCFRRRRVAGGRGLLEH